MNESADPAEDDPELLRLLDAYANTCRRAWLSAYRVAPSGHERAALVDYIATNYVRRAAIYDEWHDLDATAEPLPAPSDGEISALRKRYLRGDGVTLEELKRAEDRR